MATVVQTTYRDAIDHLVDFLGQSGAGGNVEKRDAKRAILAAYRELAAIRRWTYFYARGRIATVASYSTGTITYTNSTRTLTLASGTWPTWAAYGTVVISSTAYEVASRSSSTDLILTQQNNPGADIAAGTSYTIYRDTYPMPVDFLAADQFVSIGTSISYPAYCHPTEWLIPQQLLQSPGTPRRYCFRADPNYFGSLAVSFHPAPDSTYNYDFIYQRRPRPLLIEDYNTGTVSATASGTTLSGSGTTWTSSHIGSVIRLAADSITAPSGLAGSNPFAAERVVTAVSSTTGLTVDEAWADTLTSVKYSISDPVDLEEGAMLNAFFRLCEKQLAIGRSMKNAAMIMELARQAMLQAFEADSRSFALAASGDGGAIRPRLSWFPSGADVS